MRKFIADVKNKVLEKGEHYITSDYKTRNTSRSHKGIDLIGQNKSIDNVTAIDKGEVITSKKSNTAGNYVEVKQENGFITRYLHMKDKSLKVKKGDKVSKGEVLGRMGNTGNSTGAHLHFAVTDAKRNDKDPLPYLLGTKDFNQTNSNYYQDFILKIQKVLGTKVDGIAGPNTLNKTITISAKVNNRHPSVLVIQEYLTNLGYKEVGKLDGIAGKNFTKTIKQYQKDNNLVVDGIITKKAQTWKTLLNI